MVQGSFIVTANLEKPWQFEHKSPGNVVETSDKCQGFLEMKPFSFVPSENSSRSQLSVDMFYEQCHKIPSMFFKMKKSRKII